MRQKGVDHYCLGAMEIFVDRIFFWDALFGSFKTLSLAFVIFSEGSPNFTLLNFFSILVKNAFFVGGLNLTHACPPCIPDGNYFFV